MTTNSPTPQPESPIIPPPGLGLYLHAPFCQTKCPYCDFNTYQGIESQMDDYREAITTELQLWGRALNRAPAQTLFFGGGTPSYLPQTDLAAILETAANAFALAPNAEITLEANPGDLTPAACRNLLRLGINRLSIGVQSLDNPLLQLLGRRHNANEAIAAFQAARAAGFTNINLDLMYGLLRQTLAQWQNTITQLAALSPEHISLYALTLEQGTPMQQWAQQGKIPQPDPDLAADMYDLARQTLAAAGYRHYEISNWAQPGYESRHNLIYWRNQPYLGAGPGAHSRLGQYRFWTALSPREYAHRAAQWRQSPTDQWRHITDAELHQARTVANWEYIDPDTVAAETMFLGLRLLDGLHLPSASAAAGQNLATRYQTEIKELLALGLLQQDGDTLRLPESACLIANQVFTRFLS